MRKKEIEKRLLQLECEHRKVEYIKQDMDDSGMCPPPFRFDIYEKTCIECGKHLGIASNRAYLEHRKMELENQIRRVNYAIRNGGITQGG